MWSEPQQLVVDIPASERVSACRTVVRTEPGVVYRVMLTMEGGSASGFEVRLWDTEKRTESHRRRVKRDESAEFLFVSKPYSGEAKLLAYPEAIGKTAGQSATIRAEIQTADFDDSYPKVTFGIDTAVGIPQVKEFIENILRQRMENFEILIHRHSSYADSQLRDDSLYTDVDSRIRFIEDSPQESWIDVVIREASEEYFMLIDETIEVLPTFNIEELLLMTPFSPELILLNESSDIASSGLTLVDDGICEVADRFQFMKFLQTEKACPVLMNTAFVKTWLSNDLMPTPSAHSLGFCAAAQANTIACLPVQSWSSYDNYVLPEASLVADELAWINCQLDSYSSSVKVTLLLSELKRYATRLAAILGSTIDAKAELRFLALTGSYTSLIRATTTSQDSFIKACHTVTMMVENTFNNMLENHSKKDFEQLHDEAIAAMPVSNGSRFYEKSELKIGIVCDTFFYESIAAAAHFVPLHSGNWRETLQKESIDVLLFVTAWRGLDKEESWCGLDDVQSAAACEAFALMDACKENGIPVIFYSKEDPPSYKKFLEYAKHADCIFTSAVECIPDYVRDCGHERVYPLLFGVNPLLHNPVGLQKGRSRTVLFSGSWMTRYPDRCDALSTMFDGVIASDWDLRIIDRNTGLEGDAFPEQYQSYVSPAMEHQKLQKLHKLFDWAINVNSVPESEAMFANRVCELQACGVLLLSNYSVGTNAYHPNVFIVPEAMEVPRILDALSDEESYEKKLMGVRSVYDGNTCFDRLEDLLAGVGIEYAQPCRSVLVIADEVTDSIREAVKRQTYKDVDVIAQSELTHEILDAHDMVTWFDAEAYYGEFYLEDLVNGFKYTDSSYITKDAWFDGQTLHKGVENNYVTRMTSRYRTLFWRSSYDTDFYFNPPNGSIELPNGYAIDHFSYNVQSPTGKPERETPYKLSVIVPVYNNGHYLQGKCFASLRRSTMFEDMEIILVDDGSTDDYTLKIQDYLERQYPNVISYRYKDGGSGSASRPRNKGVELASADYITFLDPDNEAVCDGYAYLYGEVQKNNCDIVFGNIYMCGRDTRLRNYYRFWKAASDRVGGEFNFAKEAPLLSVSIQAMVIRSSFLLEKGLTQVEGAIGEDTLFSWQLVDATRAVCAYPLPIHVYYAQTPGSVTNTVTPVYFEKLMRLQPSKIQWLCENNMISIFMDKRYVAYTRGMPFRKFADAENKDECIKYIADYLDAYAPYYDRKDEGINRVADLCAQGKYDLARDTIIELISP